MSEEENIEKQPIDNASKPTEIKNISEENTQLPTTDHQLQIENMEVHKHPHHVTHKKKWGEYLLEFFMLFLAVFLGFVAENFREHQVEKERGREYVKSFREDLCKDTAILQLNIKTLKRLSIAGDSLVKVLQQNRIQLPQDLKKLYDYNLASLAGFSIILTDRTSVQLKNSGGMRLITRKKIIDAIIDYWAGIDQLAKLESAAQELRLHAREKSYLIFDQRFYADSIIYGKRGISEQAQLMTKETLVLTEFANRIAHLKNLFKGPYTIYLTNQKAKADTLIAIINKEYHLENE
ncbi:MAG: hypothetical protein WKF85_15385 [Chitinophagaceae bacterium]